MANDDKAYTAWLRSCRSCASCGTDRDLEIHHHTGRRGFGQRASDKDAMPLCRRCHHDFHHASGRFKGYDKAMRRAFQDMAVRVLRLDWDREHGSPEEDVF